MKLNIVVFVVGFILSFSGGYFLFSLDDTATDESVIGKSFTQAETENESEDNADSVNGIDSEGATVPTAAEPLSNNNCLSCHAVESLGAKGGSTGPDLSDAFTEVANKHGKDLKEFLKEPTSAVMSSVIGDNPLSDEELELIVEALEEAAQK